MKPLVESVSWNIFMLFLAIVNVHFALMAGWYIAGALWAVALASKAMEITWRFSKPQKDISSSVASILWATCVVGGFMAMAISAYVRSQGFV